MLLMRVGKEKVESSKKRKPSLLERAPFEEKKFCGFLL
jgi:hypothetical protein